MIITTPVRTLNVTSARVLYSQQVGVPNSNTTREYRLMTFNDGKKSQLYVEVEDGRSGRVLRTFSLGEALTFRKPQATVDGANNLHILFLNSPSVYTHVRINPDGRKLGQDYFKRGATGDPRLMTFANGEVRTAGGVPHDPNRAAAVRSKVRRLSERPPYAYRR